MEHHHRLDFGVEVKGSEDEESVEAYFKHLVNVFGGIVELASWAFDEPDVRFSITLNRGISIDDR